MVCVHTLLAKLPGGPRDINLSDPWGQGVAYVYPEGGGGVSVSMQRTDVCSIILYFIIGTGSVGEPGAYLSA